MSELEAVERGETARLMLLLPPGSAKSTYASILFPPWFLGRNPEMSILGVSNTTDLAERFSRRVRNIVATPEYGRVFEDNGLSADSAAAGNWETLKGGEFFAAGMGSAIAGRRADLGLIDDPIKTRQEADSDRVRQTQWDWYVNDFLTRLKPGARQILIQCMVGDTKVLLANGMEKALKDIKVGDSVATFDKGALSTSTVKHWINQGCDNVFAIKMISGRIVKANERHPFLVRRNGELEWVRLKGLRAQDKMTCLKVHGTESSALLMGANSQQSVKGCAISTTPRTDGTKESGLHPATMSHAEPRTFAADTELKSSSMQHCSINKEESAPYADDLQQRKTHGLGQDLICASTTTIAQARLEDCFATIATSPLGASELPITLMLPLSIYEIGEDEIVSITPAGAEDVFDIEVEETANFIANGCVASNTRWHEDDLGGRILEREADRWRVIKIPMLAGADDPLGRTFGERLWPEWFTQEMIDTARMDTRAWNALYQQEPVPDEGDYFKKENFSEYDIAPPGLHIYGASDYAVTDGGGDFTEHGIFGIDASSNIYVLDWWRGQAASDVWIEAMCDLVQMWRPLVWFGESGPIRRAIEPFLNRRMMERGAPCRIEWMASIQDKEIRARAIQAMASIKAIMLPKAKNSWRPEIEKQLLQFPSGKHDDAVDVFSLIGRGLEHIQPVRRPRPVLVETESTGWMG